MVLPSIQAAQALEKEGLQIGVINSRFVKPLDSGLLRNISEKAKFIFTVEEGILEGGFGSAVSEILNRPVQCIGIPGEFVTHGKRQFLLEQYGLTPEGIIKNIRQCLK
jgi:1-deoxy-D-xylulose-5-phosphate synthase